MKRRPAGAPPLRIGVAGAGRIARRFHLPALARLNGVVIVAVADPSGAARSTAATIAPGSVGVEAWEDLLEPRFGIAALVNCLPTALHADSAVTILGAGKALYLEKPLAADIADARRVAAAANRGARCQVGFNFRFHPRVVQARNLLARQALGPVIAAECLIGNPSPPEPNGALAAFGDLAVHHIDLLRVLLSDEFAIIEAARQAALGPALAVQAVMRSGVQVSMIAAGTAARLDRITLLCAEGTMILDRFGPGLRLVRGGGSWRLSRVATGLGLGRAMLDQVAISAGRWPDPSYQRALAAFADPIVTDGSPVPAVQDGLRAAEVVDAVERVLTTGAAATPG